MCHAVMRREGDIVACLDELALGQAEGVALDDLLREGLWLCGRRRRVEEMLRRIFDLG